MMRPIHLVALAAALAFSAPAFASDFDPDPATCKGVAGMQFSSGSIAVQMSGLALALTPDDEQSKLAVDKGRALQQRATRLGYALAGESAPPGENYLNWQISRLDTVLANCEKKYASLQQQSARQKWVVLDNKGSAIAIDVLNIRAVGTRKAVSLMMGFADPIDGARNKKYKASLDSFSFDCAARGNAIATLQILFTTDFVQDSLAPGAEPFPYDPGSLLQSYERIACGDASLGADLPSASDMTSAARLVAGIADKPST